MNAYERATNFLQQLSQEGEDVSAVLAAYQALTGTGKTPLGLNQWVLTDKPRMEEFNEDNRIVDEQLRALAANKANTLTSTRNVYVDTAAAAGGDGTQQKPFQTIQAAIDSLPKIQAHSNYNAAIEIAAGTYAEVVMIKGFHYGITLRGAGSAKTIIGGFYIHFNTGQVVLDDSISIVYNPNLSYSTTSTKKMLVQVMAAYLGIRSALIIKGTNEYMGLTISTGGNIASLSSSSDELRITGCYYAIGVFAGASAYLLTMPAASPSNQIGLHINGAAARYSAMNDNFAITKIQTVNGGRAYTGTQ